MGWMDNIRHDMNKCGLEEEDSKYWTRWRRMVQNPDMTSQLDNGDEEDYTNK